MLNISNKRGINVNIIQHTDIIMLEFNVVIDIIVKKFIDLALSIEMFRYFSIFINIENCCNIIKQDALVLSIYTLRKKLFTEH